MPWAPDYVTADELAQYREIDDTLDDDVLGVAATSASRAIDKHCSGSVRRQFGLCDAPQERLYTPYWDSLRCLWVFEIDDLMIDAGLVVEIGGAALVDYRLEPVNAAADGVPWESVAVLATSSVQPVGDEYEASAVARFGWIDVPSQVHQAAFLQGSRFASRRNAPFGIAGSPSEGSEMRLLSRVDPDVAVSLAGLRRSGAVA